MLVSSVYNVSIELQRDYEAIHELWVDAKNNNDLQLAEELFEQLSEMNDLHVTLFKCDILRHLRIMSNQDF